MKNIIFDMGQVLIRWNAEVILSAFSLTDEEKALLTRELFQSVEWVRQDRGTISFEEVTASVCARVPEELHDVVYKIVNGWWKFALVPNPGMGELVRELKGKGYGIYLLSNAGVNLRDYFPCIPGAECFDGLMVSGEEKLLKPQHEIYERLYQRFDLTPEECFFIDDSPANIEGALCTGMPGTVFRGDADALRCQLRKAGIL